MKEVKLTKYITLKATANGVKITDEEHGEVALSSESLQRVYLEHLKEKNPMGDVEEV